MLNVNEIQSVNAIHDAARQIAARSTRIGRLDSDIIACLCATAMRAGFLAAQGLAVEARREIEGLANLAEDYADSSAATVFDEIPFPDHLPVDFAN